jgi:tripartite-type tricarboxylate transporter receptor subunit TctC
MTAMLGTKEVRAAFDRLGVDIVATNPAAFNEYLKVEFTKWGDVVRAVKLQIN